jgi:hypothetical protein
MTGAERVLNTPLPLAYSILISQITWIYVLVLPFQLFNELGWLTIPGAMGRSSFLQDVSQTSHQFWIKAFYTNRLWGASRYLHYPRFGRYLL